MECPKCGGAVSFVAEGLNRKIVNRNVREFLCLRCLAERFQTTEAALVEAAERFRQQGCSLFPQTSPITSEYPESPHKP